VEPRSTHDADRARLRDSFISTEKGGYGNLVNRCGIGLDCHSRFLEICALAGGGDQVLKYKDRCDAAHDGLVE